MHKLSQIVEALIFASPEPITTDEIVQAIRAAASEAATAASETTSSGEAGTTAADGRDDVESSEAAPTTSEEAVDPIELTSPVAREPAVHREAAAVAGDFDPRKVTAQEIEGAIQELIDHYAASDRAFTLEERASGWRIFTRPHLGVWVRGLFPERKPQRLSQPALETLAIIAYRQPITKAAIEAVRGVSIDGPLQRLLDMNVIRIAGRADVPGRPLLYETTHLFFEHFGIKGIDDLPNAAELRRVALLPVEESKPAPPHPEQPEWPIEGSPPVTTSLEAPET
jgi:segregation and condensation protein B